MGLKVMIFLNLSCLSKHIPFILSHSFSNLLIPIMQTSCLVHFIKLIPCAFSLVLYYSLNLVKNLFEVNLLEKQTLDMLQITQ